MLRDVFYYGAKPNAHPRERFAENLNHARELATTDHFWIINEFCDYRNFDWDFDFDFLPDDEVWTEDHNNVWPSQHQKDSGTWLCPKENSEYIVYRGDVNPLVRKNVKTDNWVELDLIDHSKFDFSWHPDPSDPPYIYKWGCKYFPAQLKHVLEYHVPGATQEKYMDTIVDLLPENDRWVEYQTIDKTYFDMSWRPDPMDTPFIYVWGNKYVDGKLKPTLEYHAPGATARKYMPEQLRVLPEWDKWVEVQAVDKPRAIEQGFDFSWRPDPREPAYIYTWGNKWVDAEFIPTLEYHCEGATERKYMTNDIPVLPEWDKWVEVQNIVKTSFDFSWRPDPREPNLIYVFGNEIFDAVKMPTLEYHMEGATERKYMDINTAKLLPNPKLFEHLEDATLPNYGWLPDPDNPPYIYVWGNQWNSAEDKASVQFVVPGATEYKYMKERAVRKPCMDNWVIPDGLDCTGFDFSWEPSPHSPPYIYEFGTQWQKTGGPQYVVPGATEKTYVDFQKVKRTIVDDCWVIPDNIDPNGFDFTWHPDATDPAYDYVFATQWAFSGGPVYKMEGATGIKYVDAQTATAKPNMDNWAFDPDLIDIDSFDWSWHPYVEDQPYIYQFGTQWQKTGGPKYITPGADSSSPIKYIDTRILKAKRLPNKDAKWLTLNDYKIKDFDYSWHPDDTDEPYIYVFGNNQYPAEEMPTIQYKVQGATTVKYVSELTATLDINMDNWTIPDNIDVAGFDFSWHPNPNDPPYVYEFGTQWQKTGGPRYTVKGASETKYIDTQKVKKNKVDDCWVIPDNIDPSGFDFTWHPDATDPAYDYVFATQWAFSGGPIYKMEGATGIKYVDDQTAKALPNMENWAFDSDLIDVDSFDWSWHPYVDDQPYIYEFGTQWQKNGGPKYITSGADSSSPIKYIDTRILKATRLPNKDSKWHVVNDYRIRNFDYSWHPDNTEEPFIYVFGNTQYPAEEMPTIEYRMPGATTVKYVHDMVAILEADLRKWEIPEFINTDNFDFSWHPNPNDPPYIYEFGTQWQKTGGPRYLVKGATETKYIDTQKVTKTSIDENWEVPSYIDSDKFDFTWHPDATNPAYDYVFPTQWAFSGGPIYRVTGSTGIKYVEDQTATANVNMDNWAFDPDLIDVDKFDWSWHPYVEDQPYIYEFGTQWQKTGGPRYITSGADSSSPVKYIDTRVLKATRLPNKDSKWHVVNDYKIKNFDYSWHPDSTEEPYIYVFGNNQYSAEEMPTVEYRMPGATATKYVHDMVAVLEADLRKWEIPEFINTDNFDFSWHPNPNDPPYIYEFGTQWQKTGGPRYVVSGATEIKYVDSQKVIKTSIDENWEVPSYIDKDKFDFTWHPDATNPAYDYVFPTQWAFSGGPIYRVSGSTGIKYVEDQTATANVNMENWAFDPDLIDVDNFDWSWHPYVEDQPYIYEFGTQWQKTGGPRYVTPGADSSSPIKYIDTRVLRATRLPNKDSKWHVVNDYKIKTFDYSWHPDNTEEPYIYVFGNNQYSAEEMPTIEYRMPGATKVKYVHDVIAVLDIDMKNWIVPEGIDVSNFDFSWHPNPNDPAYIYEFATQWQKTGGPRYVVEGATETKYVDTQKVVKTSIDQNWEVPSYVDKDSFDFTWHPDATNPAYNYVFPTQWAFSGGPVYKMEGATEVKYVEDQTAKALPNKKNWVFDPKVIDERSIDFSWHPYVDDQPYIYEFGTQWQKNGGPRYITPGATENSPVKYVDTRIMQATRLPSKKHWNVLTDHPIESFDYSWHPDNTEEAYVHVFGNTQYPSEEMPTVEYRVPGAETIKYEHAVVAKLGPSMTNWEVGKHIDVSNFDFSWIPHPDDPAFIYQFGTQWQKTGGPRYVVEGATQVKYVDTRIQHAIKLPVRTNWNILIDHDIADFDYSWHPDETEEPYIYVFGNTQYPAEEMPTLEYRVQGATTVKYVHDVVAKLAPKKDNWDIPDNIDVDQFDFSWVPHPDDPAFIYQFGTQWQKTGGPKYVVPGATQIKYVDTRIQRAIRLPDPINFKILHNYKIKEFDYSWHPDETAPPYIYQFGNNLYPVDECPAIEYAVEGATEISLVTDVVAKLGVNKTNWEIPEGVDVKRFDFTWVPHPLSPPYIYQFGTKLDNSDGPRYITPNNEGEIVYLPRIETDDIEEAEEIVIGQYYIETTLEDLVNQHPNEVFWALRKNIDYTNFDFDWRPGTVEVAWELEYVHVFGSTDSELTHTYFVSGKHYLNGHTSFKYVEDIKLTNETLTELFVKPDMFYVDRGNPEAAERFEVLKAKLGNTIQKTRYLNSWVDTINRCINRSTTDVIWVLNSELDYTDFNFDYYPNPWQMNMVHVFGTQWSHWGTTFMVNRETFPEDTKYIKIIEHLSNLNFVKDIRAKATQCVHDIVVVDHGNKELDRVIDQLKKKAPSKNITTVKYTNSYFDTLKDIVAKQQAKKEHYIWICSSVCDYSEFDFSYISDPFAKDQLHVFPSGKQKFGDTFFIDVNKTREIIDEMETLEDYHKVNYNGTIRASRLPEPVIITADDTHVDAIKLVDGFPYATLITSDNVNVEAGELEPMSLWAPDTKNIIVTSTGATRIVVPKEAKDHVTNELYDYPYIKRAPKLAMSSPLDIVFLSNGEACADENYEHLLNVTKGLKNRVVRVDGIDGRVAAYHAAAEASNTPWMFTVFAKLKVSPKFDFNWQPDRMQMPKHYIFHAKNPVNGLVYGHQAMIAYNKKLTIDNNGRGLDFTLDDLHETVPLISGTAMYNTDPFSTWRTAFREVLKLKADPSDIAKDRLDAWLNKAEGDFAQYSIKGAVDADEYYDEVDGDFDALKLSYEWAWLRQRFDEL